MCGRGAKRCSFWGVAYPRGGAALLRHGLASEAALKRDKAPTDVSAVSKGSRTGWPRSETKGVRWG